MDLFKMVTVHFPFNQLHSAIMFWSNLVHDTYSATIYEAQKYVEEETENTHPKQSASPPLAMWCLFALSLNLPSESDVILIKVYI